MWGVHDIRAASLPLLRDGLFPPAFGGRRRQRRWRRWRRGLSHGCSLRFLLDFPAPARCSLRELGRRRRGLPGGPRRLLLSPPLDGDDQQLAAPAARRGRHEREEQELRWRRHQLERSALATGAQSTQAEGLVVVQDKNHNRTNSNLEENNIETIHHENIAEPRRKQVKRKYYNK